jgi:beta-glucanase (GH16 family)
MENRHMNARRSTPRRRLVGSVAFVLCAAACLAGAAHAGKRDRQPPSQPANLHATGATPSSVTFAWSASTDNVGVTGYDVSVGSASPVRVTNVSDTVGGVACGANVTVNVVAVDRTGNRSTPASATAAAAVCSAADSTSPSMPTGLSASSISQNGITLNWTPSRDDVGVAGYSVYNGVMRIDSTSATSYTLGNLACGTGYTLAVDAYDVAGNRSATAIVNATTSACATGEPAAIAGQGYRQVFGDEFNSLDRTVWDDHIWYDDKPDPTWTTFQTVHDGELDLTSSRNYFWGTCSTCNWPINTVTTLSSGKTFQYGYFEARMKWTGAKGSWPAFWLYSYQHSIDSDQCAHQAGEIDVMEGQGVEPNVFYGTVHSNTNGCSPSDQQNGNNWQQVGTNLTTGFHTYGALWTPTSVTWYLDDKKIMSAPTYATDNQPMYLLLQMWIGGWSPDPDSTAPNYLHTEVDWVHVWQK